jgi:hypothetical protein
MNRRAYFGAMGIGVFGKMWIGVPMERKKGNE